ncbi:hypothetical protein KI387_042384, partial [Taxus chinensis]
MVYGPPPISPGAPYLYMAGEPPPLYRSGYGYGRAALVMYIEGEENQSDQTACAIYEKRAAENQSDCAISGAGECGKE